MTSPASHFRRSPLRHRIRHSILAPVALAGALLTGCSDATGSEAWESGDILDRLNALPGVEAVEIQAFYGYPRAFQLDIPQPVDHDKPNGPSFSQRAYLSHAFDTLPMVFAPSGYGTTPESGQELAEILQGNCLSVTHRFFPDARPQAVDWGHLTIRQAALDHHRVVQLQRPPILPPPSPGIRGIRHLVRVELLPAPRLSPRGHPAPRSPGPGEGGGNHLHLWRGGPMDGGGDAPGSRSGRPEDHPGRGGPRSEDPGPGRGGPGPGNPEQVGGSLHPAPASGRQTGHRRSPGGPPQGDPRRPDPLGYLVNSTRYSAVAGMARLSPLARLTTVAEGFFPPTSSTSTRNWSCCPEEELRTTTR